MDISYIINQLGEGHADYFNAVAPPIMQTSNFLFDTVEQMRNAFADEYSTWIYSRGRNPTVEILRKKLAALDGAEDCLVFNSGAAAIYAAVMSQVKMGDHIVSVASPYTWVQRLFEVILPKFGITYSYIDGTNITHWENAITEKTTLFYLESPNSWTFELQDIAAVAKLAKEKGIITIIDNSYATPIYQQPIALGIDISLQSATKYIGGHSDTVAGAITGSRKMMERIFNSEYMTIGSGIQPFNAWLLLRGLRTLPMRLAHISKSTHIVLAWLKSHPKIENVLFPLDKDFPQYKLATTQMKGACGLITIIVHTKSCENIEACCNALRRFRMAVSWGGHESLIIPKVAGIHPRDFDATNTLHRSMRLYIGLEEPDPLIADLKAGFELL